MRLTLGCIELGNDALKNLVDDTGQYSLVVVCSKFSIDGREFRDRRSRQDSACDVDHLKICRLALDNAEACIHGW